MHVTAIREEAGRLPLADWAHDLLLLAATLALSVAAGALRADELDASARAHAERSAVTVCATCHGTRGNSTQPKFPRLAGQNPSYLANQLKNFRAQTRGDPDAVSYMWGMTREFDDGMIEALASYYSQQHPEPSAARTSEQLERGREIYEHGVASQGVPACSSCHGADAHGLQDFPRLAGQHAQYIFKQLASFQSSMRNVAVMRAVAQNLRPADMQSVAAYLEAQP